MQFLEECPNNFEFCLSAFPDQWSLFIRMSYPFSIGLWPHWLSWCKCKWDFFLVNSVLYSRKRHTVESQIIIWKIILQPSQIKLLTVKCVEQKPRYNEYIFPFPWWMFSFVLFLSLIMLILNTSPNIFMYILRTNPHPLMLTWESWWQFSAIAVKSASSTSFMPATRKTLREGQLAAISVITSTKN